MDNDCDENTTKTKMKCKSQDQSDSEDETWDSDDDDETIARIQRAHFAQTAAMNQRRRAAPRPRPMSFKRKMEAVKHFHDFTKKLKKDTGITIRSLPGNNLLDLNEFSSSNSENDTSDGLSEEEFEVNPGAVKELDENESYIDPVTGDFVEVKKKEPESVQPDDFEPEQENSQPKTLTISDIINEGGLDLTKNVEIAEGELCSEKTAEELLGMKQEDISQDFDITEKLKEMGEISVKPVKKDTESESEQADGEKKSENDEEKKHMNPNALNVRRNIREVMDEKQLDASTLAAQRQESERLARVQEQQRLIREVQRQLAQSRQNKANSQRIALLPGGSSILKKAVPGQKLNLPNTVLVKLPSGEMKRTTLKHGQVEVTRVPKPVLAGPSVGQKVLKPEYKSDKKEVVEIVDSSSGEESSSSSSDSDDCIMLSDSEVPPSPEADEDPGNSGLHVNDTYNIPDEQGRVLINIGHPENEEDIFLAPQIARIIKPHQIGGVRFLFDNIIESVERFSTSTGFGCILAHSMGLGKTLQIVCFCDIFLRHTKSKTVLCIMPINTLQNWVAEFNMWLPLDTTNSSLAAHGEVRPRNFPIYVLNDSHKTLQMRAKVVKDWASTGGVLMIGYELYRLLSMKKDKKPRKKKKADSKQDKEKNDDKKTDKESNKEGNDDTQGSIDNIKQGDDKEDKDESEKLDLDLKNDVKKEDEQTDEEKKLLDEMYEALVKPGPDLVICDEGHRIKNSHSNISYALKQMRTKRRVVLTGYPLQNNLLEYWCMVDFVRPNYLGSKTEFCNMFERPIQNGQCIDSTPQDIRLMRYRAHVLHSLLVGFVQRRSHAVLQSTLPQKEEYVLLVRMTPLQRKLYDRFMNEVVRSTSVPNPLKAFAICCKIWNHPDVLYNYLRKRSEFNAAIEDDLDLEEIGGMTKSGRVTRSKAQPRKPAKTRVSNKKGTSKKPAATIPPNTKSAGPQKPNSLESNSGYSNPSYPPNGPYGPNQQPPFRTDQPGAYPPYPGYQNPGSGYYPPNQEYNQNYGNNYYPQQPPYTGNYANQYPPNNSENNQNYNQNYWGNGNYYGNSEYYNNQPYENNQSQEFRENAPTNYNNSTQFPQQYNSSSSGQSFPGNVPEQYQNNPDAYGNHQRPPYSQNSFQNPPNYTPYNANPGPGPSYQSNEPPQNYPSQSYPSTYSGETYEPYNSQYDSRNPSFPNYPNNAPPDNSTPLNNVVNNQLETPNNPPGYVINARNTNNEASNSAQSVPYPNTYNYSQQSNASGPEANKNINSDHYQNYPAHLETKPPLGTPDSQIAPWPLTDVLKAENDKFKVEKLDMKTEIKSESDSELKIEDLDTKKIINDDIKEIKKEVVTKEDSLVNNNFVTEKSDFIKGTSKDDGTKSNQSDSEGGGEKKNKKDKKTKKGKETKKPDKRSSKTKSKTNAKSRKDRKTSKDKNCDSESEGESEKEKLSREEELALVKKAEEVTYDWATELLKDYLPGIIENSAKMELFFFILNESIRLGDRLLLFSQSLFTLNLIEDFLEKNYIPGTNSLWQRNTNYYRLDGSTHALEREKLINEFNANPNIYLFLVSTRAGSLGINLVGANRVIVFDSSWNPCHDTQAVCRVYRYGQKKPCFVYRFVMDWCLEKKIYDRQINKQGMADRVVDECNPDAVLSMKEITNLCFDTDEKESEPKDLSEHKDKYIDVVMQTIITDYGKLLSKEPFQHESLLVDRKEKKLSSAEKRLAQRGYELEKKAACAPKPTTAYRTVRTADGSLVQRPVASVRPMQHGARWIPADVWRRQGMTAQEMTLPLDVVIPTNSAEKTNIVLKAGQRVMVLKSPKGIYMQLESGKIIAIKTSFKMGQKPPENKDTPIGKKILGSRPAPTNLPGALKNNSAITVKPGPRASLQRVLARPVMGHNKVIRPLTPGHKFPPRISGAEHRSYSMMRSKAPIPQGRIIRPNLPGSLSITKISRDIKKPYQSYKSKNPKMEFEESDDEAHVLDSEEDEANSETNSDLPTEFERRQIKDNIHVKENSIESSSENSRSSSYVEKNYPEYEKDNESAPMSLKTDEKFPSEAVLERNSEMSSSVDDKNLSLEDKRILEDYKRMDPAEKSSKISLLKNYRHQRPGPRVPTDNSLSFLEKAASSVSNESMPDFRKNLDDITQSYPTGSDDRPASKSKKKKSPQKHEDSGIEKSKPNPIMSHSVSNLLGSSRKTSPVAPMGQNPSSSGSQSRYMGQNPTFMAHGTSSSGSMGSFKSLSSVSPDPALEIMGTGHGTLMDSTSLSVPISKNQPSASTVVPGGLSPGHPIGAVPVPGHPGFSVPNPSVPESAYGQYPGYSMGYGAYPSPSPYYGAYGTGGYYPPYPAPAPPPHPYTQPAPATPAPSPPEHYPPANPQW